jgi:hypothetical protein
LLDPEIDHFWLLSANQVRRRTHSFDTFSETMEICEGTDHLSHLIGLSAALARFHPSLYFHVIPSFHFPSGLAVPILLHISYRSPDPHHRRPHQPMPLHSEPH